MSGFDPNLSILPPHQRAIWSELAVLPPHFVLYGGTAIALRLGHRRSVDFGFMSDRAFAPETIISEVPFLGEAERLQSQENTLTVSVTRGAPVILSFFGGISFGRVGSPRSRPGQWRLDSIAPGPRSPQARGRPATGGGQGLPRPPCPSSFRHLPGRRPRRGTRPLRSAVQPRHHIEGARLFRRRRPALDPSGRHGLSGRDGRQDWIHPPSRPGVPIVDPGRIDADRLNLPA